jgi:hypothetical protein
VDIEAICSSETSDDSKHTTRNPRIGLFIKTVVRTLKTTFYIVPFRTFLSATRNIQFIVSAYSDWIIRMEGICTDTALCGPNFLRTSWPLQVMPWVAASSKDEGWACGPRALGDFRSLLLGKYTHHNCGRGYWFERERALLTSSLTASLTVHPSCRGGQHLDMRTPVVRIGKFGNACPTLNTILDSKR